jgi:glycerophosphoryl diester phosphodiesterase
MRPHGKIVEAKKLRSQIVLPQWKLGTEKAIAFAHRLGLKVVSWVINDEKTAKEVLSRKADAMATDLPDFLFKFRKSLM